MALKIRLARGGANKRPFYRIVVADSRSPRDGRFIEKIGRYNPLAPKDSDERVVIDIGKAKIWLDKGARPTDRVARFFSHVHYREIDAAEYESQRAAAAESEEGSVAEAFTSPNEGKVIVRASDAESDAKQLFGWTHGNNPQKGEPGQKAKERVAEREEREEARKAAEEEAKQAAAEAAAEPVDDTPADDPEGEKAEA